MAVIVSSKHSVSPPSKSGLQKSFFQGPTDKLMLEESPVQKINYLGHMFCLSLRFQLMKYETNLNSAMYTIRKRHQFKISFIFFFFLTQQSISISRITNFFSNQEDCISIPVYLYSVHVYGLFKNSYGSSPLLLVYGVLKLNLHFENLTSIYNLMYLLCFLFLLVLSFYNDFLSPMQNSGILIPIFYEHVDLADLRPSA